MTLTDIVVFVVLVVVYFVVFFAAVDFLSIFFQWLLDVLGLD